MREQLFHQGRGAVDQTIFAAGMGLGQPSHGSHEREQAAFGGSWALLFGGLLGSNFGGVLAQRGWRAANGKALAVQAHGRGKGVGLLAIGQARERLHPAQVLAGRPAPQRSR